MNFDDLDTEKHEIIQVVGTPSTQEMQCKDGDVLPLLAMRNMILFPGVVLPIHVGREKSLKLVRNAYKKNSELIACTQYDSSIDDPSFNDVHNIGCIAEIIKILDMPDNSTAVILQGKSRAMTKDLVSEEPYMKVSVRPIEDFCPDNNDSELKAISDDVTKLGMRIAKETEILPDELNMSIGKMDDHELIINFWASNFKCEAKKKIELINEANVLERGLKLLALMNARIQMLDVKKRVRRRVKGAIDRQQRD